MQAGYQRYLFTIIDPITEEPHIAYNITPKRPLSKMSCNSRIVGIFSQMCYTFSSLLVKVDGLICSIPVEKTNHL